MPLVRVIESQDLAKVYELEKQFEEEILNKSYLRKKTKDGSLFLVLEDGDQIVGYSLITFRKNSDTARLYSICIDKKKHGEKLGTFLLLCTIDRLRSFNCIKSITLEVSENNKAIQLYTKFNFKKITRLKHYYKDNSDAIKMKLIL